MTASLPRLTRTRKPRTALFESWRGLYSDSPRAISELLRVTHPQVRQYWVAADDVPLPEGLHRVRRHSPEYFARLVSSDLVVANDIISRHLVKGPGVNYLQTWHGTALKTIGFDEVVPQYSGAAAHRKRMVRDVAKWDHLVSSGPESTRVFRQAFRYRGRVLETGYPRNDVLLSAHAEQIRARTRAALDIPEGRRAVLYAPTWRDDLKGPDGRFVDPEALDLRLLADSLDTDTVLLMRMHRVVAASPSNHLPGLTIDVSSHQDIAELYLAADVLVSDYSSAVFDFAVTRKPILLFAHDLDHYRSGVRHLYYDYEDWAPGPIVTTTAELAEVLNCLDERHEATRARHDAFVQRFCPFEDGHATERVLDERRAAPRSHSRQLGLTPVIASRSRSYGSKYSIRRARSSGSSGSRARAFHCSTALGTHSGSPSHSPSRPKLAAGSAKNLSASITNTWSAPTACCMRASCSLYRLRPR